MFNIKIYKARELIKNFAKFFFPNVSRGILINEKPNVNEWIFLRHFF